MNKIQIITDEKEREGVFVCLWLESLPHSLLVSRVFRGIKPSPIENTEALRQTKRKSPRRAVGE